MEKINVKTGLNQSYPEIVNANSDPKTVMILKDLLSSREGEIEGVLQYIYQSRIAKQVDEDIADVLEEVAIVEMEHAELLMDAIIAFGGIPKYDNSKGQQFTASYLNYATNLKQMLDNNIVGEQQALKDYTAAAQMVTNQSLKDLLNRIAEDEQIHLDTFKTLRNAVKFLSI